VATEKPEVTNRALVVGIGLADFQGGVNPGREKKPRGRPPALAVLREAEAVVGPISRLAAPFDAATNELRDAGVDDLARAQQ